MEKRKAKLEKTPPLSEQTATESPVAEDAEALRLRLSHLANYQDLFFKLLDSAFLLDLNTSVILDANASAERLLNLTGFQIIGNSLLQWVAPEEKELFEKNLRVAKRRYHPHQWSCSWRISGDISGNIPGTPSNDPTLTFQVTACKIQLSNESEVLQVLMRDITQERQAQIQIEQYVAQLETLNRKLEELSNTDGMTGLFNFRYFSTALELEHQRALRYGGDYAIVFLDGDNFKHYNDQNGHPAGDALLRELASILKRNCRPTDIAARYGGEEFVVLLMNSGWEGAMVFAERIRKHVENTVFPHGEKQPLGKVTVSVGVASFPENGRTAQDVVKAADQAVYHSKKCGRNRVTAYASINSNKKD